MQLNVAMSFIQGTCARVMAKSMSNQFEWRDTNL